MPEAGARFRMRRKFLGRRFYEKFYEVAPIASVA